VRVGFETSALVQTRAGTARYIEGLLAALERRRDVSVEPLSFGGAGKAAMLARDVAWYLAGLPLAARRERVDVLHCPSFRAPVKSPVPLVVTVHDVAILRHPEAFNRWTRRYSAVTLPQIARAAAALIAVSEFTKRELVELLGVRDERVRVIPNAVAPLFRPVGPAGEGDYVLAVSTLEPRKNLDTLVSAFARADLGGCELRIVGAHGWGGVAVNGNRVRHLGFVPDEELARLYRGARCVAYVSRYEGFGLPVLEALACGAPVVAADLPPIREFADGAVMVDPLDPEAIAAGLEQAVAGARAERTADVTRFGWPQAAAATAAVYREVAA